MQFVDLATEISAILPLWRLKLSVYFHLGECYWKDFSSPAWMTPELRLLIRQKLKAHRQLIKDPSNSSLREHFIVLRWNATKLFRALKNRHFMDMGNEHSKSPRKLWSLLNSLTSRVKSHPPPRATLNSLSETFAAIVSDPSRPVHLVQTAETETRCTSEPSQDLSDVDCASFLLYL